MLGRLGAIARLCKPTAVVQKQIVRRAGGGESEYRVISPRTREERDSRYVMILFWYWLSYHWITDWRHVTGTWRDWEQYDPSLWTDEELGIPPDDED